MIHHVVRGPQSAVHNTPSAVRGPRSGVRGALVRFFSPAAWYRPLLRVYPPVYRERYGADMVDTFLTDLARVKRRGTLTLVSFWIVTLAQAFWFGAAERRRPGGAPIGDPEPPSRFRIPVGGDIRYALRLLVRSPLFAVTSIASLAIGLAAATVIFSVADALLLAEAPGVRDSSRVVEVARTTNGEGADNTSYPVIAHLRAHTRTLESLAAATFDPAAVSLADDRGTSERIFAQTVSGNFFDVLGVTPAVGRFFTPAEDVTPDAHPVAVMSHRFWQRRFNGDPSVLSRPIRLNNVPFVIVGVASEDFEGFTVVGADVWVPMAMVGPIRGVNSADLLGNPRSVWTTAVGRLRPDASIDAARQELNTLLTQFREIAPTVPQSHGISVNQAGRLPSVIRLPITAFVGVLFVLTGGLLAVACSNVAGMLLARASARRREIATRLAIGAGRGQLVAQLVTESLVLFVAAVLVAVPVAIWLMSLLRAFLPTLPVPLAIASAIDWRAIGFAGGLALATGLVFGMVPARFASKTDLVAALYGQGATSARDRLRLRRTLVVVQVALSLTMIITASLFVRTLLAAARVDTGFAADHVDVVMVDTRNVRLAGPEAVALIDRVVERVRGVRGVELVGHSKQVPLQGGGLGMGGVRLAGADEPTLERLNDADWDVVSPDYFRAIGLPIVHGRAFLATDRAGQPDVVIVNESFARIAWPGESAIGKSFVQTDGTPDGRTLHVVGVARDAKYRSVGETPRTFIYLPFAQQPLPEVALYVKYAQGVRPVAEVRAAIASVESSLPVLMVQTFDEATSIGLIPQRIAAWVAGSVGVVGVLLAAMGLYGLMAFLVAQRTREIAIRMALGATVSQVRSMVLGQAGRLTAIGAVLGIAAAAGIGRVVESLSLLIDIRPEDPLSFIGLSTVLAAVLFLASDLPARRAARTNPAATLKAD